MVNVSGFFALQAAEEGMLPDVQRRGVNRQTVAHAAAEHVAAGRSGARGRA